MVGRDFRKEEHRKNPHPLSSHKHALFSLCPWGNWVRSTPTSLWLTTIASSCSPYSHCGLAARLEWSSGMVVASWMWHWKFSSSPLWLSCILGLPLSFYREIPSVPPLCLLYYDFTTFCALRDSFPVSQMFETRRFYYEILTKNLPHQCYTRTKCANQYYPSQCGLRVTTTFTLYIDLSHAWRSSEEAIALAFSKWSE